MAAKRNSLPYPAGEVEFHEVTTQSPIMMRPMRDDVRMLEAYIWLPGKHSHSLKKARIKPGGIKPPGDQRNW